MGKGFEKEVLGAHNEYRKLHNTAPVKWSKELAKAAQAWADHLAKEGRFEHAKPNQRKGQGENIAFTQGRPLSGDGATKMWYDEVNDYNFNEVPRHNSKCGHFTQVIWNDTTEIGAGIASKDGKYFIVARYSPPGNMLSQFPENIKPPVSLLNSVNNAKNDFMDAITKNENEKNIAATNNKHVADNKMNGKVSVNFNIDVEDVDTTKDQNKRDEELAPPVLGGKAQKDQENNNKIDKSFNSFVYKMEQYKQVQKPGPKLKCETIEVVNSHLPVPKRENNNKYIELNKSYEIVHYVY